MGTILRSHLEEQWYYGQTTGRLIKLRLVFPPSKQALCLYVGAPPCGVGASAKGDRANRWGAIVPGGACYDPVHELDLKFHFPHCQGVQPRALYLAQFCEV